MAVDRTKAARRQTLLCVLLLSATAAAGQSARQVAFACDLTEYPDYAEFDGRRAFPHPVFKRISIDWDARIWCYTFIKPDGTAHCIAMDRGDIIDPPRPPKTADLGRSMMWERSFIEGDWLILSGDSQAIKRGFNLRTLKYVEKWSADTLPKHIVGQCKPIAYVPLVIDQP